VQEEESAHSRWSGNTSLEVGAQELLQCTVPSECVFRTVDCIHHTPLQLSALTASFFSLYFICINYFQNLEHSLVLVLNIRTCLLV
jgi:hypothetical protein